MFCHNCGCEVNENENFCLMCGVALDVKSYAPDDTELRDEEIPQQSTPNSAATHSRPHSHAHAPDASNQSPESQNDKRKFNTKLLFIPAAVLLITAGILLFLFFSNNSSSTKSMQKALESGNAVEIRAVYTQANGNQKLTEKYDELLAKVIEDITDEINDYSFDSAGHPDVELFWDYLRSNWGNLLITDNHIGVALDNTCLNEPNLAAWNNLINLIISKKNYVFGLKAFSNASDYPSAIRYFSDVLEFDSEFENAQNYMLTCAEKQIAAVMSEASNRYSNGEDANSFNAVSKLKKELDVIEPLKLQEMIDSALSEYSKASADKAAALFQSGDIQGAIANINISLQFNDDHAETLSYYKSYLPFEMYIFDNTAGTEKKSAFSTSYFNAEEIANNAQNFPNSISVYHTSSELSYIYGINYNLGRNYDYVSGTLFISQSDKHKSQMAYFEVYGDGKLIYASPNMETGNAPKDFSFSVAGIDKLKIQFYGVSGSLDSTGINISNLKAYKNING